MKRIDKSRAAKSCRGAPPISAVNIARSLLVGSLAGLSAAVIFAAGLTTVDAARAAAEKDYGSPAMQSISSSAISRITPSRGPG